MGKFNHKVVLITGASSGIGAFLAREFAVQGASLVLVARREDRLFELALELEKEGAQVLTAKCDVTRDGDLERVVTAAVEKFGKIDVVVANAGFGVVGKLSELAIVDYRRQFETNVFGVLRTIYSTLDQLKKSRGILVLMGSVSGYLSLPEASPYSMSKFAIHALASSITHELRPEGVSVVLVAPGLVESEFRNVDNQGAFRAKADDSFPQWLIMPTQKAARQIVAAVARRQQEVVITFHGKVAVYLRRFFPFILNMASKKGLSARSQPD